MSILKSLTYTLLGLVIVAALTPIYPPLPFAAAIVAVVILAMRHAQRQRLEKAWSAVLRDGDRPC